SECSIRKLHRLSREDSRVSDKPSILQVEGSLKREFAHQMVIAMKSQPILVLAAIVLSLFVLVSTANAQQPTPTPTPKQTTDSKLLEAGEDAGPYTVVSSLEVGYRGQRVDGDLNKYRSDLNYKAGARLFDSSFLMKALDGKGGLFDT